MTTTSLAAFRDAEGDPRPDAVVSEFWPYDGPHTSGSIATAAYAVDELTGYLANATRGPALDTAAGYALLGAFTSAAGRLEQILRQTGGRIDLLPDLFDDRGADAGETVALLQGQLHSARTAAETLGRLLGTGQALAGHLGQDPDR